MRRFDMSTWARAAILGLFALWTAHATPAWAQTAPLAITSTASNQSLTAYNMTGFVCPNGTNTSWWFVWGWRGPTIYDPGNVTNALAPAVLAAGTATNTVEAPLVVGLSGTRTYYELVASNVFGVVTGGVENAVTFQVMYNYTGPGTCNVDTNHPTSAETLYALAQAEQQTRTALIAWESVLFNCDGSFQNGAIPASAVGVFTNALYQAASYEGSFTNLTITGSGVTLASTNVTAALAGTYRFLKFEIENEINNGTITAGNVQLTATWATNGGSAVKNYPASGAFSNIFYGVPLECPISWEVPAGTGTVSVTTGAGTSSSGLSALTRSLRIYGVQ
jgi:hypothetical protein